MDIKHLGGWVYYVEGQSHLKDDTAGKWMFFFEPGDETPAKLCQKAVESGVVGIAKHTDDDVAKLKGSGVTCFYLNIDDRDAHKKVINFFLEHNLIQKTKTGKLYNISFKLNNQTRAGEYGNDFKSKLTLDQLVDLHTGEWIAD